MADLKTHTKQELIDKIQALESELETYKNLEDHQKECGIPLHAFVHKANFPICHVDNTTGQIKYFNNRFLKTFGYSKEEVPSLNEWWELAYPDKEYREWVIQNWTDAVNYSIEHNTDITPDIYKVSCKDGSTKHIFISGLTIGDDFIATFFDMTNQKKAELELKKSEELFKALVTNSEEIIYMIDMNGTFILSEGKGLNALGLKAGEVVGKNVFQLFKAYPYMLDQIKEALSGKKIHHEEEVEGIYFKNWYSPFFKDDGTVQGIIGLSINITKQRLTQKALSVQKKKLNDILEGTNAGTWNWNIKTGEVTFNERWAEIIGKTLNELEPTDIKTWINHVHPEDLNYAKEELDKHFKKESDYYDVIFRQPHKDGSWVWVNARGKVIKWDTDGRALRMSGTHIDITERMQVEEELNKYKDQLEQKVEERTKELELKNNELDEALKVFVGRERTIIKLTTELNKLKNKS